MAVQGEPRACMPSMSRRGFGAYWRRRTLRVKGISRDMGIIGALRRAGPGGWTHGIIPRQMLWSIVVLIPNGGGDYRGIGLLELI